MKSVSWTLRVSKEELARWKALAGKDGRTLSGWIRWKCNTAKLKPAKRVAR